jgi:hypothetical protein
VLNFKFLEKVHVFILKFLFTMVGFLVQNVIIDIFYLRMTVRKRSITLLPTKFSPYPVIVIDEVSGILLEQALIFQNPEGVSWVVVLIFVFTQPISSILLPQ